VDEFCTWEEIEMLTPPKTRCIIAAKIVVKQQPTIYVSPDGGFRVSGVRDAYKKYRIEQAYKNGDSLLPFRVRVVQVQELPPLPSTACLRCPLTRDACATCQFNHKITF
jgi:hypothetical protein